MKRIPIPERLKNSKTIPTPKYVYLIEPEGIPPFTLSGNRPVEEFAVDLFRAARRILHLREPFGCV